MKLENWAVVQDYDPYMAPEDRKARLHGTVYGHPKHDDGKRIATSSIQKIDPVAKTVTTRSGSVYELGTVDPEWEAQFPDAANRFWNNSSEDDTVCI